MSLHTKKLAAAIIGTAFCASGAVAQGLGDETGPSPNMNTTEKGLFSALEAQASVLAGLVTALSCGGAAGTYPVSGSFTQQPNGTYAGSVRVDRSTVRATLETNSATDGTSFQFSDGSNVADPLNDGVLKGLRHSLHTGQGVWDATGAMYVANLDWRTQEIAFPNQIQDLDQHIIKDFYLDTSPPQPFTRVYRDSGLELITKKRINTSLITQAPVTVGYPKAKWRQDSFYRRHDGVGAGQVIFDKVQIAPFAHPLCFIRVQATVDGLDPSAANLSAGSATIFSFVAPAPAIPL